MAFLRDAELIYLLALGLLAIGVLISQKPKTSAIILFLQSLLVSIFLGFTEGLTSAALGTSILLSFFSMILVGINLYYEASFAATPSKIPKINVAAAAILIFLYFDKINPKFVNNIEYNIIDHIILQQDLLTMTITGFSLFSILFASIIIFRT